jgi:FAD/FMN-containing dehydrogenase
MSEIILTHKSGESFYNNLYKFAQNLLFETPKTPQPRVILNPFLYSQVATAIFCSKKTGLQMRIRSGGHDFEGSSYVADVPFFILNTYAFRSIKIDVASKTAWVQAGASLGEVYYNINKTDPNLAFPAGYWATVCTGGHISGGGYGPLVRRHGLAADHVLDAIVMDANGNLLDRKSMGEDFFWAIRGGVGSSFGVILAYKLGLVENRARISAFTVEKFVDQGATPLLYKWEQIAHKLPLEITLSVTFINIISPKTGKQTIQSNFVALYIGDIDGLLALITETFPELGVTRADCVELDYPEYFMYHFGFPVKDTAYYLTSRIPVRANPYFKAKSDFVQEPIPIRGLEKMWDLMTQVPPGKIQMEWTPFGGRNDEISPSSIPFPHRAGNSFIVWKRVEWNTSSLIVAQERIKWMTKFHDLMGRYIANNPRKAYADYTDYDLGLNNPHGPTSVEQARKWGRHYFLGNFDRLVRVKTAVDPENFFKLEQSIPPALSAAY